MMDYDIILVDDDESVLYSCRKILENDGFNVMTVTGIREFIMTFEVHGPDIVVTDYKMSDGLGSDIRNWLLATSPSTPVILITGDVEQVPTEEEYGYVTILEKPFRVEELLEAVHEAVSRLT